MHIENDEIYLKNKPKGQDRLDLLLFSVRVYQSVILAINHRSIKCWNTVKNVSTSPRFHLLLTFWEGGEKASYEPCTSTVTHPAINICLLNVNSLLALTGFSVFYFTAL